MTDALNPAIPIGGSQVEVASELRGIKARLVADKAAIEELQVDVDPLVNRGAVGDDLLASVTVADARTALDIGAFPSTLLDKDTLAEVQNLLGITSQGEVITTTTGSIKGTIKWIQNFKLQFTIDNVASGGGAVGVTWREPFAIACFGCWVGYFGSDGGSQQPAWISSTPDLNGVDIDHNSASTKKLITFGIGI